MNMETFDPFMESLVLNFGENSSVVRRWNKLFNDVGFLVKKYECIEDYPMGVYHLYFYFNNGKAFRQGVEMNYGNYSYAEDLIVDIANKIEDEICREGQMINVTASWDTEQKWVKGPLIGPKNDKWKAQWEAKWDIYTKKENKVMIPEIKDVIFNNPATIVKWADGTKTVVKVQKGEPYDEEKGLAMAFIKKIYDNKGNYNDIFRKWCPKKEIPKVDDFNLNTFIDYIFSEHDYV